MCTQTRENLKLGQWHEIFARWAQWNINPMYSTLSALALGSVLCRLDTAPHVKLILVTFQFFKINLPVLACMLHFDLMCHSSLGTSSDEYNYIILSVNITSSYSYHGCIGNMMNATALFLESSVGSGPDFQLHSFVCLDMCL